MADPSCGQKFPRPFESSYAVSLGIAMLALVPYILVTTAFALYRQQVAKSLGAHGGALEPMLAFSVAGYAFGAMLGGDLIQRFPQRKLFLLCEGLFIIASIIAATAGGVIQFGIGQVLEGLATGFLLVIALPPVIRRFPPEKMSITSAAINLAFFGAVTAGPLIGAAAALGRDWRWFYGGLAGLAAIGLGFALFTLPDQPPPNPELKFDRSGVLLALGATALPFWAAGELRAHAFASYFFTVPVACGIACLIALMLVEYHKQEPLAPVKPMFSTFPAVGLIAAAFGGGTYVAFLQLAIAFQTQVAHQTRFTAGLFWWPQIAGVVIAALALAMLVNTRYLPLLTLAGMLLLIGGGAMLLEIDPGQPGIKLMTAAGMLGLGAGATVSPGLWMAGFSLPSKMVGRTFALVELVRSDADYLLSPVLMKVAEVSSGGRPLHAAGAKEAIWITLLIVIAFTAIGTGIYLFGTGSLLKPDLPGWLQQERTAFDSPEFGAALHRG